MKKINRQRRMGHLTQLMLVMAQGFGMAYAADCSDLGPNGASNAPECRGPITTSPRGVFDNGARVPVEQRRNDSVFNFNRADPSITLPSPCAATTVSWTQAGVSCSGPINSASHNVILSVNDSTQPNTGAANFICNNGGFAVQPGATCTAPPPAAVNCAAGVALTWDVGNGQCNATSNATATGGTLNVTDSVAPLTGAATFSCNNGTFTVAPGATCAAPPPVTCSFPATTITWGPSSECSVNQPATTRTPGQFVDVFDNGAPTTGSLRLTCNPSGNFTRSNEICNGGPVNNNPCSTQLLSWTGAGGQSCSASSGARSHTQTFSLASSNGNTGTASYTCNNGSYALNPGATCGAPPAPPPPPPPPAPPPANCSISGWFNTQSGTGPLCGRCGIFPLNHGQTVTVVSENGLSGQSTQTCNNGVVSITNPSCSTTGPLPANATSGAIFTTDSYGAGGGGQLKSFLCFNVGTEEANLAALVFRDQNNNIIGSWDNNIESIFIRNNTTRFLVWENPNFPNGQAFFYDSSTPFIGAPLNNSISSIRMVTRP